MNAPGDTILLVILLALFLACCGYAAGRLHQRYQLESDREEAYRDGYDEATRSVFGLAARVVGPRRSSTRGIVPAQSGSPENDPQPAAPASPASPTPATPEVSNTSVGFPVPPPPPAGVVAEPPAPGGVTYRPFPDPRPADGSGPVLGPIPAPAASAAPEEPAVALRAIPDLPGLPDVSPALRRDVPPGSSHDVSPGSRRDARQVLRPDAPGVSRHDAFGSKSGAVVEEADSDVASSGRHLVPDALIDGTTYRLPPDRVFRAKVAGASLPEDPTTPISVPKPRES